jgi:uncharacterized membrane protein
MTTAGHLWAIGYEDVGRADQVRDEITKLGWVTNSLLLADVAVVRRHADGSFVLERERYPFSSNVLGASIAGFLAGLVLAAPVTGATIGALMGLAGSATATAVGISKDFVREVEALMKPGTSALFVLDHEGNMDAILHRIRGLGGTILKTNVDAERARLIQSTLTAPTDK